MFTYQERDSPKMPHPFKIHLPILPESILEEMNEENYNPKQDQVNPTRLKLPAANLRGTSTKAYKILTEISSQIGWDMLLKYHSSGFVMEEEYCEEKKNLSVVTIRGTSQRQSEGRMSQTGSKNEEFPTANGNILQNGAGAEENGEASISRKPEISVTAKGAKATKDKFTEEG
jgi:hypothetical protein